MGNDPGPLTDGEEVTVILKLTGPLSLTDADDFKKELDQLLGKFRPRMKGLTRPVARPKA